MRASAVFKDTGFKRVFAEMEALRNKQAYIKVGVIGAKADNRQHGVDGEEGMTNAELATIHEYGAPGAGIPARSFIRSTIDHRRSHYANELLPKLVKALVTGKITLSHGLDLFGLQVSSDVKKTITGGESIPPPLAPATIAKRLAKVRGDLNEASARVLVSKLSNGGVASTKLLNAAANKLSKFIDAHDGIRALVDTGRLVGSITYAVVIGDKEAVR